MQRIRSLFFRGRKAILGGPFVAALAGLMLADDLFAQTRQRYAPRSSPRAAAPPTERSAEDDVMELPTAPIPSLNAPARGMKTPDVELKDGEILVDGNNKLPTAQE